ncbi:unnamed protein product, partial [Amoebophrya sp. A25]
QQFSLPLYLHCRLHRKTLVVVLVDTVYQGQHHLISSTRVVQHDPALVEAVGIEHFELSQGSVSLFGQEH